MSTTDLISAIINGSAVDTEEAFNSVMAEKIAARLDDMRTQVASTMFGGQVEEDTVEEIEQVDEVQEEVEQVEEANLPRTAFDVKRSYSGVAGGKGGEIPDSVRKQGEEIAKIFAKKDDKKNVKEEAEQIDEAKPGTIKPTPVDKARAALKDPKTPGHKLIKHIEAAKKYNFERGKGYTFDEQVEQVDEKAVNPYAVGMAAAMKSKGDTPPLSKSTIVKGHEIAKKIIKKQ